MKHTYDSLLHHIVQLLVEVNAPIWWYMGEYYIMTLRFEFFFFEH